MKLSLIESGLSRREFLKRGAAALAAGPQLAAAAAAPKSIPFIVTTGTHYGRGSIPYLSEQFENVARAFRLASGLSSGPVGYGIDEDAYFTGSLPIQIYRAALRADSEGSGVLNIGGRDFVVVSEDSSIYFESEDGLSFNAYLETPDWLDFNPIEPGENPIKLWWDSFGKYGDELVDQAASKVIEDLDLDTSERGYEDEDYEEDYEDEEDEDEDEDDFGSMHQSFDIYGN